MASGMCWNVSMLRREDRHVLRRALEFVVEGERKKRDRKEYGRVMWRKKALRLV